MVIYHQGIAHIVGKDQAGNAENEKEGGAYAAPVTLEVHDVKVLWFRHKVS